MITEISRRVKKIQDDYVGEIKVLNEESGRYYFVVARIGTNLLYARFDGSFIDYETGVSNEKPFMIEGDSYMWYEFDDDGKINPYRETYGNALQIASNAQISAYAKRKFAHTKKPDGSIKFEIVRKRSRTVFACGPLGEIYEIEFNLPEEGRHVFVCADESMDIYSMNDYSIYDCADDSSKEPGEMFEYYEGFAKTKKSKYYALFYEAEKFKYEI